jgi:hypothetical protein
MEYNSALKMVGEMIDEKDEKIMILEERLSLIRKQHRKDLKEWNKKYNDMIELNLTLIGYGGEND